MKILFVTSIDATNFRLVNIIKEFIRRGHIVYLYPYVASENNIRMFKDIVEINWIHTIDQYFMDDIDAVFCGHDTVMLVNMYKKYIFTFNMLSFGNAISEGGDFMFVPGNTQRYDKVQECVPFMKVGSPMYDDFYAQDRVTHNILFIDSGHYPFSDVGKDIVAKLVLDICKKHNDYTVTIKPRFLKKDKEIPHKNNIYLCDKIAEKCGGCIPPNLIMLEEHIEMKKLMEECDTVICMYTGAYLDAAVMGKGLIIIDGLPSESYTGHNDFFWDQTRKVLEQTGCLVHYSEVEKYLPCGIKCAKEHIEGELLYRQNVSERIVNVIEYIIKNVNSDGKYLSPKEYSYANYQNEFKDADRIDYEQLLANRIYNKSMYRVTRLINCIDHNLDIVPLMDKLNGMRQRCLLSLALGKGIDRYVNEAMRDLIEENADSLKKDEVKLSFLLDFLFKESHSAARKLLEELKIESRVTYYYDARFAHEDGDYERAAGLFWRYLDSAIDQNYEKYLTDKVRFLASGFYHLGLCYFETEEYAKAISAFEKANAYSDFNHTEAQKMIFKIEADFGTKL